MTNKPHPMAVAMEWVPRVMVVAVEMVLPGMIGQMLDRAWGLNFLALVGFALGISLAIWHLIVMTTPAKPH